VAVVCVASAGAVTSAELPVVVAVSAEDVASVVVVAEDVVSVAEDVVSVAEDVASVVVAEATAVAVTGKKQR
jgi:hypothetical protein